MTEVPGLAAAAVLYQPITVVPLPEATCVALLRANCISIASFGRAFPLVSPMIIAEPVIEIPPQVSERIALFVADE